MRLMNWHPPKELASPKIGMPRKLQYHPKDKAYEWRCLQIFYGDVIFDGLIPEPFLIHFSMLTRILFLTLKERISPGTLVLSRKKFTII